MNDADNETGNHNRSPAIVLCGGQSRRMGRNKATLPLGSGTVLQRVADVFATFADYRLLVIGCHARMVQVAGFDQVIRDEALDLGPLEGLRVGLRHIGRRSEIVSVGTCDAPQVVPAVYVAMLQELSASPDTDAVVPRVAGRQYPLTAVYRTTILDTIQAMVDQRQLRVRDMLARIRVREFDETQIRQLDPDLLTIRNINTQADYEALLRDEPEGPATGQPPHS